MYVGLLSTFLLLWLHPALGEGRGGRGGDGNAVADREGGEEGELERGGGEEGEPGGGEVARGEKQCVRKVVMEERRVPR